MSNGSDPNPYTERNTCVSQPRGADDYTVVLVEEPAPHVRRITMNRPEKRNALNHALRGQLLHALQAGDMDENVRVMIIRGAGSCFSAGYDLGGGNEGKASGRATSPRAGWVSGISPSP